MDTDYFGARYNPDEPIIVNSEFMVARIKQQLRQLICWSLTSLSGYLHPVMREARSPELTIYYDRRRQTISEDPIPVRSLFPYMISKRSGRIPATIAKH